MTSPIKKWTVKETRALVEEFELGPWASGPLSGLSLVVQETVDVEERVTGCGNCDWKEKRTPAAANAIALDLLLFAGAQCLGNSRVDEFAFGLIGESNGERSPVNPVCEERVTGGAASGAASAVAGGLVDIALVTDCGGSTVVPSSNCGLAGWRSSRGAVPSAGLIQVCPSFDSVGVIAGELEALVKTAGVLLSDSDSPALPPKLILLEDALAGTESGVRQALQKSINDFASAAGTSIRKIHLKDLSGDLDLHACYQTFTQLQYLEVINTFGSWLEERRPRLGQEAKMFFFQARRTDRSAVAQLLLRRRAIAAALNELLKDSVVVFPSTPTPAPVRGFIAGTEDSGDYYTRALSLAALSAIAGAPQATLPLAAHDGLPMGISFMAAPGQDMPLLRWLAATMPAKH